MQRFRVGEIYEDNYGNSVRIICNDAGIGKNNVVGLVTLKDNYATKQIRQYNDDGYYCGVTNQPSYAPHHLISSEPTDEEAQLIAEIRNYCERESTEKGKEESLLKVIRQLRKK